MNLIVILPGLAYICIHHWKLKEEQIHSSNIFQLVALDN